ncbi:(deoxy)nucleoside triphosphate pyrophosphohydrolase [Fervidibacillus albus]|uniref:8-oxo-dGTP diphosphatase n=1 Tax=Fervidibacillus albus TaxID=2980026 RepID=A0A9E8RV61_9BACI|nr:(deoxy)nucleoside triphosphate pyrophosphohydrolase [Fervidibacillus albus]WAA08969.1 (deoxy)nucleoside triphosphate pyrophosphohydrolase [Fervidibacillus albus]
MKKAIRVVGAVIMNEKEEVLCALRSPEMTLPNLWEFPGGKIEKSETPEESLIREIKEELGCTIQVKEKVKEVHHEYPSIIVNLLTYKAKIIDGKPKAKEHAELKWVPIQELYTLDWAPADVPTVNILLADKINK